MHILLTDIRVSFDHISSVYGRYAGAPVIDTLFGGQLVSSVECLNCHKVTIRQ